MKNHPDEGSTLMGLEWGCVPTWSQLPAVATSHVLLLPPVDHQQLDRRPGAGALC